MSDNMTGASMQAAVGCAFIWFSWCTLKEWYTQNNTDPSFEIAYLYLRLPPHQYNKGG